MLGRVKGNLFVFLIFSLLSFILFWPIFLGKVNLNGNLLVTFYSPFGLNLPYKLTGLDQLRIFFPGYGFILASLKNLTLPLWNPYYFAGNPYVADFQSAVFYPLNLFGLFLNQVAFWHLMRIAPLVLSSFFTFLYLRNLKLSKLASFFGATAFGFSPFILTWGEEAIQSVHPIIWLPLALFAVDKFIETKKIAFLALLSFCLSFSILAGFLQLAIYLFVVVFLYIWFRLGTKKLFLGTYGLYFFGAVLLGVGICAVQLAPSAELFFNSARENIALRQTLFNFLVPIRGLLNFLSPDFFGNPATHNFFNANSSQYYERIVFVGVMPLVFAFFAFFCRRLLTKDKKNLTVFLAVLAVISLSLTLDLPTSKLFLTLPIPFLSTSIANRILFIPAFCLSILAALGFDLWYSGGERKVLRVIFAFGLIYLVIILYLVCVKFLGFAYFTFPGQNSWQAALMALRNMVFPVGVFIIGSVFVVGSIINRKYLKLAACGVIIVSFIHTFYFAQKYFSFGDPKYIFPETPIIRWLMENQGYWRSWGVGGAGLATNLATQYRIFWPEGYDSLNSRAYSEFTDAMQGGDINNFKFRADAGLGALNNVDGEIAALGRRRLVDIVGVKYVIAKSGDFSTMSKNNFRLVYENGNLGIFENLEVLPRAFLASNYEGPPDIDTTNRTTNEINAERRKLIPKKLTGADFDFRNVLVLEKPSPISAQYGSGTAVIVSYKPQEVIIKTNSKQPKILFLSDSFYPGWKVKIDGQEGQIMRADYAFRAVPLVPGAHTVIFYYDSDVFKIGVMVSVIFLALSGYFILIRSRLAGLL